MAITEAPITDNLVMPTAPAEGGLASDVTSSRWEVRTDVDDRVYDLIREGEISHIGIRRDAIGTILEQLDPNPEGPPRIVYFTAFHPDETERLGPKADGHAKLLSEDSSEVNVRLKTDNKPLYVREIVQQRAEEELNVHSIAIHDFQAAHEAMVVAGRDTEEEIIKLLDAYPWLREAIQRRLRIEARFIRPEDSAAYHELQHVVDYQNPEVMRTQKRFGHRVIASAAATSGALYAGSLVLSEKAFDKYNIDRLAHIPKSWLAIGMGCAVMKGSFELLEPSVRKKMGHKSPSERRAYAQGVDGMHKLPLVFEVE